VFIASTGIPETYGISANLNYKTEKLNYFTSLVMIIELLKEEVTDANILILTVLLINILMKSQYSANEKGISTRTGRMDHKSNYFSINYRENTGKR
jgi:hypothetical protein